MAKAHYKVRPEDLAIAESNGIPTSTFYRRLANGWDLEKAKTQPSRGGLKDVKRSATGEIESNGLGRNRSIRLSEDLDPLVDQYLKESGQSAIALFRSILEPALRKLV